jgi:hypothetical protein
MSAALAGPAARAMIATLASKKFFTLRPLKDMATREMAASLPYSKDRAFAVIFR